MTITFFLLYELLFFIGEGLYCLHMGSLPEREYLPSSHHQSILEEVVEGR